MSPLNIEETPLIGRGRTAELYSWGDGRVLKLFKNWCSPEMVEREASSTMLVHKAGLPVPAFHGIEEVNGRLGIVMDRIEGVTLGHAWEQKPRRLFQYARVMAELHVEMHRCEVPELPSRRERMEDLIGSSTVLSTNTKDAVLDLLDRLPDGNAVCHGDFYIENVMLTSAGPIIIDWFGSARGNPLVDVARTWLLHRLAEWPVGFPEKLFVDPMRILFHRAYMRHYLKLVPASRKEISRCLIPVMAARLAENVKGEKDRFVRTIENSIRRS
jgi:uncharacterized protein (TIGR02172 family)